MCPWEPDIWCKYQADKQNNTTTYKDQPGLPAAVRELIKPIFMNLSNDELLKNASMVRRNITTNRWIIQFGKDAQGMFTLGVQY